MLKSTVSDKFLVNISFMVIYYLFMVIYYGNTLSNVKDHFELL